MAEAENKDGCISTRTRSKKKKAAPQANSPPLAKAEEQTIKKISTLTKAVNFDKYYRIRLIPRREDALPDKIAITGADDETIYRDLVLPQPSKDHPIIIKDEDPDAFDDEKLPGPFLVEYTTLLKVTPQRQIGKRRKSGVPKHNPKDLTPSPVVETADFENVNSATVTVSSLAPTLTIEPLVTQRKPNYRRRRSSVFLRVPQELVPEPADPPAPKNESKEISKEIKQKETTEVTLLENQKSNVDNDVSMTDAIRRKSSLEIPSRTRRRSTINPYPAPLPSPIRNTESETDENVTIDPLMFGHHPLFEEPVPPTPPRIADLDPLFRNGFDETLNNPMHRLVENMEEVKVFADKNENIEPGLAQRRGRRSQLHKYVPMDEEKRQEDEREESQLKTPLFEVSNIVKRARRRSSYFKF